MPRYLTALYTIAESVSAKSVKDLDASLPPAQLSFRHSLSDRFPLLRPSILYGSSPPRLLNNMARLWSFSRSHLFEEHSTRLVRFRNVGTRMCLFHPFSRSMAPQEMARILLARPDDRSSPQSPSDLLAVDFDDSSSTLL